MGSQDTHRLPCIPRPADNRSDVDRWLEKFRSVVNEMPESVFIDGTLKDIGRLKVASATFTSKLEGIYVERRRCRHLADRF